MGRPKERVPVICQHCDKVFHVTPFWAARRKYCSRECHHAFRNAHRPIVQCHHCGIDFQTYNCHLDKERHFCSQSCTGAWKRIAYADGAPWRIRREPKPCPQCKERFTPEWAGQKYCTAACGHKARGLTIRGKDHPRWRGGDVAVSCEACGKKFTRCINQVERANHIFCSVKCRAKRQGTYQGGADHPMWKGGYAPYYGPDWPAQRAKARERDSNICQHCGKPGNGTTLDIHHKIPFRTFGYVSGENNLDETANKLTNLITLCMVCHRIADAAIP